MINRTVLIGILTGAGICLALACIRIDSLTLRLPDHGDKIYYLCSMDTGDRFSLTYRHSVEKTLVKGTFEVSERPSILSVETRMTSVGTGLPNTFSKRTTRDGKWIVVDEGKKEIDSFRFFISPVNDTTLATPGEEVDLMKIPSGTVVLVGVERLAPIHYVFYWSGSL